MDRRLAGFTNGQLIEILARRLVVVNGCVEMGYILLVFELREQGGGGIFHSADKTEIDMRASADLLTAGVDLDDLRLIGKELRIGKIGAEHQQQVAAHHGVKAGGEAQQT